MKATALLVGVLAAAAQPASAQPSASPSMPLATQQAVVAKYCTGCHNDRAKAGGFSWTTLDLANPADGAARAEKVIRRLRAGLMPPGGAPRPDRATSEALAHSMEEAIDKAAAARPYAGAPELHRLNRAEYRNSVRELLGIDADVASMLPPDEVGRGFANMSDALSVNPALVQGYVRAASKISRAAVGDAEASPAMTMYKVPKVVNQMRHVDGAPWGTRGGTAVVHDFPADGDYTFKLAFYYDYLETLFGQSLPANLQGQQIEVAVDGARVAIFTIDPNIPETKNLLTTPKVHVTAGPHRVAAAFIAKFDGPTEDQFRQVEQSMVDISAGVPGLVALPHLLSMTVAGPFAVTGVGDTVSRQRIFTCRPATEREEPACAQAIIGRLARQAYRAPVSDADAEFLFSYYREGRKDGGFEGGVRMAVQAMLANPRFLFRFERTPRAAAAGGNFRVSDLELASRLSYFLWSSAPDERLVTLAANGRLSDPAVLEAETRRMLADARSSALVDNFAVQWLRLQGVKEADPVSGLYPEFTRNLGESMTRETKLLFESVIREDHSVRDLLTADYTYVDELLARHYGIPNVQGSEFRRVAVTDPNRIGLLGHASVLTLTSLANRTSPVLRGKYVMEVLLGVAPPAPPPNVPPLNENVENQKALSVRERLEQHRKNPACAACHKMMDPIGLSLENFNAIGAWRTRDSGAPVDPSGQLYDGAPLDGPVSLRTALLDHSDSFIRTFAENFLSYGLGRLIDYRDLPAVRAIEREAARHDYRFSSFVLGVARSVPFQMRKADDQVATAERPDRR